HAAQELDSEFGYMMELAMAESGMNMSATVSTSSAQGAFQFIEDTWRTMVALHGDKYCMTSLSEHIAIDQEIDGTVIDVAVKNPFIDQYMLTLRNSPHIAAIMGAESNAENLKILEGYLGKDNLARTDLYLAHFLGPKNAAGF